MSGSTRINPQLWNVWKDFQARLQETRATDNVEFREIYHLTNSHPQPGFWKKTILDPSPCSDPSLFFSPSYPIPSSFLDQTQLPNPTLTSGQSAALLGHYDWHISLVDLMTRRFVFLPSLSLLLLLLSEHSVAFSLVDSSLTKLSTRLRLTLERHPYLNDHHQFCLMYSLSFLSSPIGSTPFLPFRPEWYECELPLKM